MRPYPLVIFLKGYFFHLFAGAERKKYRPRRIYNNIKYSFTVKGVSPMVHFEFDAVLF